MALDGAAFIDRAWVFLSQLVGIFAVQRIFTLRATASSAVLWAWALVPIYAAHQFEEHGWDALGRRYAFLEYFNSQALPRALGVALTPRLITVINAGITWFSFPLVALWTERSGDAAPAALLWGIAAANAAGAHCLVALLSWSYNPGLATSALLMGPASVFALRSLTHVKYAAPPSRQAVVVASPISHKPWEKGTRDKRLLAAALLTGGPLCHGVLMLLPLYLVGQGKLSVTMFARIWLFGTSALPLAIAHAIRRAPPAAVDARPKTA